MVCSCMMTRRTLLMLMLSFSLAPNRSSALQPAVLFRRLLPYGTPGGLQGSPDHLPHPSAAGYLSLPGNASLYFAYYESLSKPHRDAPIVLWLQVTAQLHQATA
jgi:hypothetical protein